ncbi:MAG: esterase/lipase family protein, partial [Nitrosarchaeum sp.]
MKKLAFIIILMVHGVLCFSQLEALKDKFSKLDTTRLTTNILYDLVIPQDTFSIYTGTSDTVFANNLLWENYYEWLKFAHLKSENLPELSEIITSVVGMESQNKIPIGVIMMKYNQIKENSFYDHLLEKYNGYYWDGPNTSTSPYFEDSCFIASALIDTINTLTPSFVLSNDFEFNENTEPIQYYKIDFGDGNGFITLNTECIQNLTYSSYGEKTIKIEAYTNSSIFYCNTRIYLESPPQQNVLNPLPPVKSIHAQYGSCSYAGYYEIFYGCDDEILDRPVIVVEGFDFNNERNLFNSGIYNVANQNGFVDTLRSRGYDVILLDFANGGAMIQANAMILRALIDTINNQKTTHVQNVIMGASMGGLIARYALSYMEFNNEDHHTRLFISFDVPNQGAYFPLASQHLTKDLGPLSIFFEPKIAKQYLGLMSPAAKQMLVYHCNSTDYNNHKARPDQLRLDFLRELDSLSSIGYPKLCRKIAIAQGSGEGSDGIQSGLENNDPYLELNDWKNNLGVELTMKPLPHQEEDVILDIQLHVAFNWWFIHDTIDIALDNVLVDNTKPYDMAPGSNYGIMADYTKGITD